MQAHLCILIFNALQIYRYKKLMQATKNTCRYEKIIVILRKN